MIKPFVRHASEVVLTTPIFRVRKDRLSHPRSGHTADYYVLENPDWVNVVALSSAGKLLLVRQWRVGANMVDLELPAGLIEPGESPEVAAARELREETGYAAERVTLIGRSQPNSAYQQNTCFTALALGCTPTGATAFDPGEDIELVEVAPAELPRLVAAGEVRNALVITALYFWLASAGGVDVGALGAR